MKLNRLSKEKSLYLRQHSTNPVDWYPWSKEAFEIAKRLDKPIFLSIGYSSCHWCHVMEEESFRDEEVALLMNKVFVNIKVDREERPDIDAFYMKVCQFMTGSGGWPLTIIMTPDQKPFFAGTYFPKHSVYSRIGLIDLINNVEKYWLERREEIENATINLLEQINNFELPQKYFEITPSIFNETYDSLKFVYDSSNGGFGSSPKFPMPFYLHFLLDYAYFEKKSEPVNLIEKTLLKMRNGGIFDQVEYGFHRYSTDSAWNIPHFEKMLYDQSLLLMIYSKTYLFTKKRIFKQVASEIIEYMFNKLKSPDFPAFYSSEDADSEGIEGKYYVFSFAELKEILDNEIELFAKIYNISEEGNFSPHNWLGKGFNILHLTKEVEQISSEIGLDLETLYFLVSDWRKKLRKIRSRRVPPALDNKILVDWNGLAIVGLSAYYKITKDKVIEDFVYSYYDFLTSKLFNGKTLYHSFVENEPTTIGMLNDYLFTAFGFFEASQSFLEPKFFNLSKNLIEIAYEEFWDYEKGGFLISNISKSDFIFKTKEFYDGVIPSGNSLGFYLSNALFKILGDSLFKNKTEALLQLYSKIFNEDFLSYSFFINSLYNYFPPTIVLTISLKDKQDLIPIKDYFREQYYPDLFINIVELPQNSNFPLVNGNTSFFLCLDFECLPPTNDFEYICKLIEGEKR